MGIPDGAYTHGSGSGGAGSALLILLAVALLGPAVAATVAASVHALIIAAAVIGGLAVAGVVALAALRVHRWRAGGTSKVSLTAPPPWRPVQAHTEPPAIEPTQEVHVHHHWHGVTLLRTSPRSCAAEMSKSSCRAASRAYSPVMDPTVAAALIGVGGAVIVAVVGFLTTRAITGKTIRASDRQASEARIWDKRATAYEAALAVLGDRAAKRERWLRSSSETWTAENRAEYFASYETPEWFAVQGRLLAYSSQQVLKALAGAQSADHDVAQAFDNVGERREAGQKELAAATLTWDELQQQVSPLLEQVREAVEKSRKWDEYLVSLMQTELQGRPPDRRSRGRARKGAA